MTRNEANFYLALILEAAAVDSGAPSGILYAALIGRLSLDEYQGLIDLAKNAGLVIEDSHLLSITDKGRKMVKLIEAARAVQKAG